MKRSPPGLSPLLFAVALLIGLAANAGNYALLVGATEYPSQPKDKWLTGPTLDCGLVGKMLKGKRFGFEEKDIQVLAGRPKAEAKRQTRQMDPESLIPTAVLARARNGTVRTRGGGPAKPSGMLDGMKARGNLVRCTRPN